MINYKKMIAYDEGKRLKVYKCTEGFKTVGIGCNLDANPHLSILGRQLQIGDTISEDECTNLFEYDYGNAVSGIQRHLYFFGDLLPKYQAVIVNMVFQMGITGFLKFKGTIQAMRDKNDVDVVSHMKNSLWYTQTKNRAERLISIINDKIPKEYL